MAKKKKTKRFTPGERGALSRERGRREEKRASTCHVEVRGSQKIAFVKAEQGRWIRTHVAAAFTACPIEECGSTPGFACLSTKKGTTSLAYQVPCHNARIVAYYDQLVKERGDDPRVTLKKVRRRA